MKFTPPFTNLPWQATARTLLLSTYLMSTWHLFGKGQQLSSQPGLAFCQERIEVVEPATDRSLEVFFLEEVHTNSVIVQCIARAVADASLLVVFNQSSVTAPTGARSIQVFYDIIGVRGDASVTCSAQSIVPGSQYTGESASLVVSTLPVAVEVFPPSFVFTRPGSEVTGVLVLSTAPSGPGNLSAVCGVFPSDANVSMTTANYCTQLLSDSSTNTSNVTNSSSSSPSTPQTGLPPVPVFPTLPSQVSTSTPADMPGMLPSLAGVAFSDNRTTATLSFSQGSRLAHFSLRSDDFEATASRNAHGLLICCMASTCANCSSTRYNGTFTTAPVAVDIAASYNTTAVKDLIRRLPQSGADGCRCNLDPGRCNFSCCCDTDCSSLDKQLMPSCTLPTSNHQPHYMCNSAGSAAHWSEWNNVLCVHGDHNPTIGLKFPDAEAANTSIAFQSLRRAAGDGTTVAMGTATTFITDTGYRSGQPLQIVSSGESNISTGILTLPSSSGSGCFDHAPVEYLVNRHTACMRTVSVASCSPESHVDIRNYLVASLPNSSSSAGCWRGGGVLASPESQNLTESPLCDVIITCQNSSRVVAPQRQTVMTQSILVELNQTTAANDSTLSGPCDMPIAGQPPRPAYNTTTNSCDNALLSLSYTLQWQARRIQSVSVNAVLGNIPIGHHMHQQFAVAYNYLPTVTPPCQAGGSDLGSQQLSGNPGYVQGRPLRLGTLSGVGDDVVEASQGLLTWNTAVSGQSLCSDASQDGALFGRGVASGCLLRVSLDDVQARCASLREQVLALQESMVTATHIAATGSASYSSTADWREIIRPTVELNTTSTTDTTANTTDTTTSQPTVMTSSSLTTTSLPSNTNASSNATGTNSTRPYPLAGLCAGVPSTLTVNVLYSTVGQNSDLSARYQILSAYINITSTDWLFSCGNGLSCEAPGATQLFEVSSAVNFVQVPSDHAADARISVNQWQERPSCRHDNCAENLLHPFTTSSWQLLDGRDKWFTVVTTLVAMAVGIVAIVLNATRTPARGSY